MGLIQLRRPSQRTPRHTNEGAWMDATLGEKTNHPGVRVGRKRLCVRGLCWISHGYNGPSASVNENQFGVLVLLCTARRAALSLKPDPLSLIKGHGEHTGHTAPNGALIGDFCDSWLCSPVQNRHAGVRWVVAKVCWMVVRVLLFGCQVVLDEKVFLMKVTLALES